MKLIEIINVLEEFAPLPLQESYDNSGLLIGNSKMEITGAILCLDAIEEVIDEAIEKKCNLIIAHHPIIFSGLKKIIGKNYVERTIIKAIKNDIAIYAAHTNLDNVQHGVNKKICEKLQLQNVRILSPVRNKLTKLFTFVPNEHAANLRAALFAAGAGAIGNYDDCSFNTEGYGTFRGNDQTNPFVGEKGIQHRENETKIEVIFPFFLQTKIIAALKENHPYEVVAYDIIELKNQWDQTGAGMVGELEHGLTIQDFLEYLKQKMKTGSIRYTKNFFPNSLIQTVAVCGGAGSFLLDDAIKSGAQCFISSDFKYHQFFDAENKIMIADIGHYESEQFTPEIFAALLKDKFPTFAAHFTSVKTNPINYY